MSTLGNSCSVSGRSALQIVRHTSFVTYHGTGGAALLVADADGLWTQNSQGVANASGSEDHFGGMGPE